MPIVKWRLRRDTSRVIIDAARPKLTRHLANRFQEDIGQNVNLLGEVVVGDGEADKRYYSYLEALKEPDITYISVKISGIYAQTHALNYKESIPELMRRMSELYQTAIDNPYVDHEGKTRAKFVNLDMEEYKDAHLTMKVFKDVLSLPQFKNYEAGIVVQAYLPDAWGFQTELLEFARKRVAEGGSPIKMRIVKGCNLDMENIVSDLRGWPNPVRPDKTEVDANYLHIIERGLLPENAKVLHIGMASHNLFTISYAYLLTEKYQTPKDCFCFEMLEGMANHVWRAQKKLGNHVILYTPVVKKEHFLNAISYLVRRMDENTAPDNFLTHSFSLRPNTPEWDELQQQFINAYNMKDNLTHVPARVQDRNKPYVGQEPRDEMINEPDTDFDRVCNQRWVEDIFAKWCPSTKESGSAKADNWGEWKPGDLLPTQIGKELVFNDDRAKYFDRSQPGDVLVCEMSRANKEQTEKILDIAEKDAGGWRKTTIEERHKIMYKAANILGEMRGDLCGAMCAITGKTIEEGDVEVSEGIDYCRFYTTTMKKLAKLDDVDMVAKGTVLVLSPWNFPCAIPCGGVVAALASGNTCILKPATVAAPVAWLFAKAFWEAGVPKEALQVVITDREATPLLTSSPVVKHIILTGGTETAQTIAHANPRKPLSAETGGKNVMILSAKGDRDHAIMNACRSAFGNAGQKCSACSLLLVERSVYDNPEFFTEYIAARDRKGSLNDLIEQPEIKKLLPDISGKRVLDLGCGYGTNCAEFSDAGAARVVGIDLSEKMLGVAKSEHADDRITFVHMDMSDVDSLDEKFDLIFSSLAFHYVRDFESLTKKLYDKLNDDGELLFSQFHPLHTAGGDGFDFDEEGNAVSYKLRDYARPAIRRIDWIVDGVEIYHRTFGDITNSLSDAGFVIRRIVEPMPSEEAIAVRPKLTKHFIRPCYLIVSAIKKL